VAGASLLPFDGNTSPGDSDAVVAKFNSTGHKQWSKRYGGAGQDFAVALAVDKVNNLLYVTGNTLSPVFHGQANSVTTAGTTGSMFLLTLSPSDGSVQSARVFSGTDPSIGNAITTNGAFIYIAGAASGTFQGHTIAGAQGAVLLKIEGPGAAPSASPSVLPSVVPSAAPSSAPTGGVSLRRVMAAGGSTETTANAVSVLSTGAVVLSGITNGNIGTPTAGVRKSFYRAYTANGDVDWTQQVSAGSHAQPIGSATDTSDNVYVAVRCQGSWYGGVWAGSYDACAVKFNTAGTAVLSVQTGGSGDDRVTSIAVDVNDGSFYMAGGTSSNSWMGRAKVGSTDGFVTRHASNGSLLSLSLYGTISQVVLLNGIAVDRAGYVWSAGYTTAPMYQGTASAGGQDMLLQKTTPAGVVLFARRVGNSGNEQGKSQSKPVAPFG